MSDASNTDTATNEPPAASTPAPTPPKPVRRIYNDPREEWGAVYPDEEEDEQADEAAANTEPAPAPPAREIAEPAAAASVPEKSSADAPLASESTPSPLRRPGSRNLVITMRRTGDVNRDKYRLREIYELVRDPRGRGKDAFFIRLDGAGGNAELSFPNDWCEINDKLLTDLQKRMRLGVEVITP